MDFAKPAASLTYSIARYSHDLSDDRLPLPFHA